MKTDGTPLHGSYFDQAAAKHPDLESPASERKPPKKARSSGATPRRRWVLPAVLCGALFGVAWLVIALKPEATVSRLPPSGGTSRLPPSGGTRLAVESGDRPVAEPARQENAIADDAVAPPSVVADAVAAAPSSSATVAPPSAVAAPPPTAAAAPPPTAATAPPPTAVRPSAGRPARSPEQSPAEPPAVVPARKIFAPSPEYPDAARHAGKQGTVVVEADVDVAGVVTGTRIVRGLSPELDAAAAAALGTWRFEPARRGDVAIASSYRVGIRFALRDAETEPPAPLEVGGEVEPPRRLTAPLPAYPDAAWAQGVTGDVLVRAVIDENGDVAEVEVVKGLPYGMTEAAVEAIRRWKFVPATRRGQPVAVYRNLSVRFEG